MSLLALVPLVFTLAAVVLGRWWVVVAAACLWATIALYLVANDGWFGAGWGDFGILLNVLAALATIVGAAAGVALNRLVSAVRGRRRGLAGLG